MGREMSASMLTTLHGCHLAFYFQYIAHEKVPEPANLLFGAKIHYMLKLFYDKNFKSVDSFINFWRGYWFRSIFVPETDSDGRIVKETVNIVDKGGKIKKRKISIFKRDNQGKPILNNNITWNNPVSDPYMYANIGVSILKMFYERHKQQNPPEQYEKPFRKVYFKGHLLRGVWDRIDVIRNNGLEKWFITDYKTDSASPEQNTFLLHHHPQFTIYSLAFREVFCKEEKDILFYHLRSGKVFKTRRSQEDFDYLQSMLDKSQRVIENKDYTPFYGFHCNWCKFRDNVCSRTGIGVGAKLKQLSQKGPVNAEEFREWTEWSEDR